MLLAPAAWSVVSNLPNPPGPIEVQGTCPSAAAVEARLRTLQREEAVGPSRRVRVAREGAWVRVSLWAVEGGGGGSLLAERRLPGRSSCADLADAVAVVVSAWSLALPPRPPAEIRLVEAPRPQAPPAPLRWEVAVGGLLSTTGHGGLSGGGLVSVALGPRRLPLQGVASFYGSSRRFLPVAEGGASWTRLAPALGLRWQPLRGALRLSLRGELLMAALLSAGQGFPVVYEGRSLDLGALGGVRLGFAIDPRGASRSAIMRWAAGFLDLAVLGWLIPQGLRVLGQGTVAEVPRFEVLLSAGAAFGAP